VDLIKIPEKRVVVLIGADGKTKKEIEKKCRVKLRVEKDGEVQISGEEAEVYFAHGIVQAIGRGFEPRQALKLLQEDYQFYLINLKEFTKSDNALQRIKGRVIGEDGKIKEEIEQATDSYLSIYGNTIGIISKIDSIEYAKEAVLKLVGGAKHSSVLNYLAGVKRRLMEERLR